MSESKLNSDELNIASRDVNHSEPQFNPNLMPEGGQFNVCPTCGGSGIREAPVSLHRFYPCLNCHGTGIAKATSPVIEEAAQPVGTGQGNNTTVGSRLSHDVADERLSPLQGDDTRFEEAAHDIVWAGSEWSTTPYRMTKDQEVAAIIRAHREAVVRERVAELQHMKQAWGNDSTMDWEDWIDGRIAQLRKSSSSS